MSSNNKNLTYNRQPPLLSSFTEMNSFREQRLSEGSLSSVRSEDLSLAIVLSYSVYWNVVEVAMHTILYVRQVYPPEIFVRRKKFDTPVFQSRHPALNEYISGAIKAVGTEIVKENLDKVVVVIKDKQQNALERFMFSLEKMLEIESYNKDTTVDDAMTPGTLSSHFRAFLVKLNMIEAQLGLLESDEDISFAILIELKEGKEPTAKGEDPAPWIPADNQHTTQGASEEAELHIIRSVHTGILNVSLTVQESVQKMEKMKEVSKRRPQNV